MIYANTKSRRKIIKSNNMYNEKEYKKYMTSEYLEAQRILFFVIEGYKMAEAKTLALKLSSYFLELHEKEYFE